MPASSVTSPFVPKSVQRLPVFESTAIKRASVVAVRILLELYHARAGCSLENSLGTICGRRRRLEIRDATTRRGETDFRVLELRVEAPALRSRVSIERGDDVARQTDIERVADLQRRRLERAANASAKG